MNDHQIGAITRLLNPSPGEPSWHGGATPLGSLRGVFPEQAAWKPAPKRSSIWELTLHITYWKYAVRRVLDNLPKGAFPRKPADFPKMPKSIDTKSWNADKALLKSEHKLLCEAVAAFDPSRLTEIIEGRKYPYSELLFGIAAHDIYHVGQIQLLKRLFLDRAK